MTFEELWKRFYDGLVGYLVRFGRRPEDAEELASDALTATWRNFDRIDPDKLTGYVATAARRAAMNHHRNATRRGADRTIALEEAPEDTPARTPEELAIVREQVAEIHAGIRAVMNELPEETRFYIVLRHRGYSYEDIARTLGVRIPAVQSRLYRATKAFEERLGAPPKDLTWIELAGEVTE